MLKNHYRWLTWLALAMLFVLLVWGGYLGWHGYRLYSTYQQAKALATQKPLRPQEAVPLAQKALQELTTVRAGLAPVLPLVRGWSGPAGQVEPLLDYAIALTRTANHLLSAALPVWETLQDEPGAETGPDQTSRFTRAVELFSAHQADLDAAVQSMEQAAQARAQIQMDQLPPALSEKILPYDRFFPQARAGVTVLAHLPALAGADHEQAYLIAAQNNDELRATGGFISAAGLARVHQGRLVHLNLSDSYMLDNPNAAYPDPPQPLYQYMDAGVWLLRDANWSPDFPTAARQMEALYELSLGAPVDGVMVFDQLALVQLLAVLGPVSGEGFPEPVSASNVLTWMREAWAPEPGQAMDLHWWTRRKEFIQDLGQAVIAQLFSVRDPDQIQNILKALLNSMQQGHILVYFHPAPLQSALQDLGLDGGVHPGPADYLFLVDTNIGFNKTDAVIRRMLTYRVDLSNPQAGRAALQVMYNHPIQASVPCEHEADYGKTYTDLMERCYWDYWRVLAAPGSQLLRADTRPVPAENILSGRGWDGSVQQDTGGAGTVQFSGLLLLPTASQASWQVEWSLPATATWQQGESVFYQLTLQKQPGINDYALKIEITPPSGKTLSQPPAGWQPDGSVWVWEGKIQQSTAFILEFR